MNSNFIDFEQPIVELLRKLEEVHSKTDSENEVRFLKDRLISLTKKIFDQLDDYQKVKLARHPMRPHTRDYFEAIFSDFDELYGDRNFSSGTAIIGGIARLEDEPVVVIGQQKGRNVKENLLVHFGMPYPEEYRKALRLMKLAEKFQLPIFTFIDTPGAYPGIEAEERNQSEAIARNLLEMSRLRVPIICTVIGEGGSGGALALAVGDRLLMLKYAIFSTISPEGCASILWKSTDIDKVRDAAKGLNLTSDKLYQLKLIDEVIPEPLGGAHRDYSQAASLLKNILIKNLRTLQHYTVDQLLEQRYARLRNYGA